MRVAQLLEVILIFFFLPFSVKLATLFPDKLSLGFEIREKVSRYVQHRIAALRSQDPGAYDNVACIRTNAMKYMLNFFREGQVRNESDEY